MWLQYKREMQDIRRDNSNHIIPQNMNCVLLQQPRAQCHRYGEKPLASNYFWQQQVLFWYNILVGDKRKQQTHNQPPSLYLSVVAGPRWVLVPVLERVLPVFHENTARTTIGNTRKWDQTMKHTTLRPSDSKLKQQHNASPFHILHNSLCGHFPSPTGTNVHSMLINATEAVSALEDLSKQLLFHSSG